MTHSLQIQNGIKKRVKEVILATFAADSFSLGSHWIYEPSDITKAFSGKPRVLADPLSSFHHKPMKHKGELTHIGQNALILLESMASKEQYDLKAYMAKWQEMWDVNDDKLMGYKDSATKSTLAGLKEGKRGRDAASDDDDMSHTIRWFPLLALLHDEKQLVQAAGELTGSFTRGEQEVTTAQFYAHVLYRIIHKNDSPIHAINAAATALNSPFINEKVAHGQALADKEADATKALVSLGEVKITNGKQFRVGLTCGTRYGLPAVIYAVTRATVSGNKHLASEAIVDTVAAGGNSNARAMAIAAILYGQHSPHDDELASEWINGLKDKAHIEQLVDQLLR